MVAGKAKNAVAALAAARLFNAAGGHDNEPKILKPFRNGYIVDVGWNSLWFDS